VNADECRADTVGSAAIDCDKSRVYASATIISRRRDPEGRPRGEVSIERKAPQGYVDVARTYTADAGGMSRSDHWLELLRSSEAPRDADWMRMRSRVVALLAPAGSGKSWELLALVDRLRAAGEVAFFFRIERLCRVAFSECHDSAEEGREFERWLRGSGEATLILDAVDEAKLPLSQTARPLQNSLTSMAAALGDALARVRVIVSCRSSEWHDAAERKQLQTFASSIWEARKRVDSSDPAIEVAELAFEDLTDAQIAKLGQSRGADDGFLPLLKASDAVSDCRSPMDAVFYADSYVDGGGKERVRDFGSRSDIVRAAVERRLRDAAPNEQRNRLNPKLALLAVRQLAFATVVAQQPALGFEMGVSDAIDVHTLLSEDPVSLSSDQVRMLLSCPVFVPNGPGLVRFYRPEVAALLAADHVDQAISDGASPVGQLTWLVSCPFGTNVVPSAYGPMLAWLALRQPVVLRRLVQDGSEWVISEGDPRSLPLDDRRAALKRYASCGAARRPPNFFFGENALERFASPDLEADVVQLLQTTPRGEGLLDLILLTSAGRYRSAGKFLVGMLIDPTSTSDERVYAMKALLVCGSDEELVAVADNWIAAGQRVIGPNAEMFLASRDDSNRLSLVFGTYPRLIDVEKALALLGQLHGERSWIQAGYSEEIVTAAPPSDLSAWVKGLDELCFTSDTGGPYSYSAPDQSAAYRMLARGLRAATARVISERPDLHDDGFLIVFDRLRRARRYGPADSYERNALGKTNPALRAAPRFRQLLFEGIAASVEHYLAVSRYFDEIGRWDQATIESDLAWIQNVFTSATSTPSKALVDLAETELANLPGKARLAWTFRLCRELMRKGELRNARLLAIEPTIRPVRIAWWQKRHKLRDWRISIRRARYEIEGRALRRWDLIRRWFSLPEGKPVGLIGNLLFEQSFDVPDAMSVRARFGSRLGNRVIAGAISHASAFEPSGHVGQSTTSDLVATAGLGFAFSEKQLQRVDPSCALRLVLQTAISWPDWASEIARSAPDIWRGLVSVAISRELSATDLTGMPSHYLRQVDLAPEDLKRLVARDVLDILELARVVPNQDAEYIDRIVRSDPAMRPRLAQIAKRMAREGFAEGSFERGRVWTRIWMRDDEEAIEEALSWSADDDSARALLMMLGGGFGRSGGIQPRLEVDLVERLAEKAYQAINPRDDEPHREGVHSVTERDRAEESRRWVDGLLSANLSLEGRALLERFIGKHVAPINADWARRWLLSHEREAAKPTPWTIADIRRWNVDKLQPPATAEAMFDQIVGLIEEIELELARSEFDRRPLFHKDLWENDFRSWLGFEIDRRHRGWYSITQETVTANEKRSDLRLERRHGDEVVVIEIKLAHRWTREELLDKFTSQLFGRYLLSERVKRGIYLLVDIGLPLKPKPLPDGSTPSLDEIVMRLNTMPHPATAVPNSLARAIPFRITVPDRTSSRSKVASSRPSRSKKGAGNA